MFSPGRTPSLLLKAFSRPTVPSTRAAAETTTTTTTAAATHPPAAPLPQTTDPAQPDANTEVQARLAALDRETAEHPKRIFRNFPLIHGKALFNENMEMDVIGGSSRQSSFAEMNTDPLTNTYNASNESLLRNMLGEPQGENGNRQDMSPYAENRDGRREPPPQSRQSSIKSVSMSEILRDSRKGSSTNILDSNFAGVRPSLLSRGSTDHSLNHDGRIFFASNYALNGRSASIHHPESQAPATHSTPSLHNMMMAQDNDNNSSSAIELDEVLGNIDPSQSCNRIIEEMNHLRRASLPTEPVIGPNDSSLPRRSMSSLELPPALRSSGLISQNPTSQLPGAANRMSLMQTLSALNMNASSVSLARIPQQFFLMPSSVMVGLPEVTLPQETPINLNTMDAFYRSNFTEYVTDALNVLSVARDMARVSMNYDVATVCRGIDFVTRGWNVDDVAKMLKVFTIGWKADKAALLLLFFTKSSPRVVPSANDITFARGICELTVLMIGREDPDAAALFIYTLTKGIPNLAIPGWPIVNLAELVSWIDLIGAWDRVYFRDFTASLVTLLEEDGQVDFSQTSDPLDLPSGDNAPRQSMARMSKEPSPDRSLRDAEGHSYTSKLNLANFRLAIVNFQLIMAESEYAGSIPKTAE